MDYMCMSCGSVNSRVSNDDNVWCHFCGKDWALRKVRKRIPGEYPEVIIIDNRMEWYMRHRGISGVTMDWSGRPALCDTQGRILPYIADRIVNQEFYQDGDWPRCPFTGKKLPIAHE